MNLFWMCLVINVHNLVLYVGLYDRYDTHALSQEIKEFICGKCDVEKV